MASKNEFFQHLQSGNGPTLGKTDPLGRDKEAIWRLAIAHVGK